MPEWTHLCPSAGHSLLVRHQSGICHLCQRPSRSHPLSRNRNSCRLGSAATQQTALEDIQSALSINTAVRSKASLLVTLSETICGLGMTHRLSDTEYELTHGVADKRCLTEAKEMVDHLALTKARACIWKLSNNMGIAIKLNI